MYYLQLDKEPLYPAQSRFVAPPQYQDFPAYHHPHPGLSGDPQTTPQPGAWSPAYPPPPPRDDWSSHYGPPPSGHPPTAAPVPAAVGPGLGFNPGDYPGPPPPLLPASLSSSPGSPQRRNPYEWIRRSSAPPTNPSECTGAPFIFPFYHQNLCFFTDESFRQKHQKLLRSVC